MKKLVTLLLAAGLVFAAANPASAVEVKPFGQMEFVYDAPQNFGFLGDGTNSRYAFQDSSDVMHNYNPNQNPAGERYYPKHGRMLQRFIVGADFIVSESLSAHYDVVAGFFTWGGPTTTYGAATGGYLGSRATNIVMRQSYLDWIIPNTQVKVRMGVQAWTVPSFAIGAADPFGAEFGSGIQVNIPFNKTVSLTLGWVRAASDSRRADPVLTNTHKDDLGDMFLAVVPVKLDGFNFTPWGAYALIGKDVNTYFTDLNSAGSNVGHKFLPLRAAAQMGAFNARDTAVNPHVTGVTPSLTSWNRGESKAWWLGIGGELVKFDPFRFAFDAGYSSMDTDKKYWDRAGWYVGASAEYKTAYGVPTLKGWYASGDDSNPNNGSERLIGSGFSKTGAWAFFSGNASSNMMQNFDTGNAAGTWGLSLGWNKFSFIDKLFHNFRVSYVQGTNSKHMAQYADPRYIHTYLTTKDSLVEVDFETVYSIYANLAAALEINYLFQNIDGKWRAQQGHPNSLYGGTTGTTLAPAAYTPGSNNYKMHFSDAWRVAVGLRYAF